MNPESSYYLGIMSGTSSDGIDVALIDTNPRVKLLASHSKSIPVELQKEIHMLANPVSNSSIDQLGELDQKLGHAFADAVLEILNKTQIPTQQIAAIGSHGQTVRHRPSGNFPFTLQIGDPNIIAAQTGITTVADFRRRDMALGGQGAPLVPAFHQAVFSSEKNDRAVVNIGGMANITWLPKNNSKPVIGFDTGPGNVLMDAWIQQHKFHAFDMNGEWAAKGKLNELLLSDLKSDPFFKLAAPKSTGREMFNLELTAQTIADSIHSLSLDNKEIFICGGGAFNQFLMHRLEQLLANPVQSTEALGVSPQWVEAMAFAWLAHQRMQNLHGNICAVTGAKSAGVLGAIYFGS
jgi:anhydro-N-acetylmuramic acid kinase